MDASTPPGLLYFHDWCFGHLKPHGYGLLMIDPPWPNRLWSARGERKSSLYHYGSMTIEELCALPVKMLAQPHCIDGLAREHSRKPEEAYAFCERWAPGVRRAELFSRTSRPGWDTWGFEAGKFDPVVSIDSGALA